MLSNLLQFGSLEEFQEEFKDINQEEQISRLHKMLAPHLLRSIILKLFESDKKFHLIQFVLIANITLTCVSILGVTNVLFNVSFVI